MIKKRYNFNFIELLSCFCLLCGWGITGCSHPLEKFCQDNTQAMCEFCYRCALNDEAASRICDLTVKTDLKGCQLILNTVCMSEGGDYFRDADAVRACTQSIEALDCQDLQSLEKAKTSCQPFFK